MRPFRCASAGMLLLIAMLSGCAAREATPEAPPADMARLAAVRQSIRAADPAAIVGIVTEVLPTRNFAAVGDVPTNEFRAGEAITFIDTNQRVITHGIVRHTTDASLHVEYDPPPLLMRPPRVGDLAVRFKRAPSQSAAISRYSPQP